MTPVWSLVLLLAAPLAVAGPCRDDLGGLHANNTHYYNVPDLVRRCRIYSCVDDQAVLLKDSCNKTADPPAKFSRLTTSAVCTASNGRRYYDRQTWWETLAKPCTQYVCRGGQRAVQQAVSCPPVDPSCTSQEVFGKCCPKETDCGASKTCYTASDEEIAEGATWWESSRKPCTQYQCRAGAPVHKMTVTCPRLAARCRPQTVYGRCCPTCATSVAGAAACRSTSGRVYSEGQTWWESAQRPCRRYICRAGRKKLEHTISCPTPKPRCRTVPSYGQCCPTQTQCDDDTRPCTWNGTYRPHGSQWQIDACTVGTCRRGVVQRTPVQCPPLPPGCQLERDPATCCPRCAATTPDQPCLVAGSSYQHNQTWGDECAAHLCNNGKVISQYSECPPAPRATCAPVRRTGSCCVRWSCETTKYWGHCRPDGGAAPSMLCYEPGPHEGLCTVSDRLLDRGCCPTFDCLGDCLDTNRTRHPHDSSWQHGCSTYRCSDGVISTTTQSCAPPVNQHCRLVSSTDCCPSYDCGCEDGGQRREDGALWTAGCHQYSCKHGQVESRRIACAPPPRPDCTAGPPGPPDYCCPQYKCSCAAVLCAAPPTEPGCQATGTSDDGCCTLFSCAGDCKDEQGRVHTEGSNWSVKCTKYHCAGGSISQVYEPCPPPPQPSCTKRYLRPDDCCPVYDCPAQKCVPGEHTFDGCNHCTCLPPGTLVCTRRDCSPSGCSHHTGYHKHGADWVDRNRPCIKMSCRYGTILSSITQCPPPPGPLCAETPVPGECCPRWDCTSSPCPANYTDVTWEDDCNVCTCNSAGVVCTEHICPKQCVVAGTTYETGDVIIGADRCNKSTCIDGVAVSVLDECKRPPSFLCREIAEPTGDCCPSWECQAVPGMSSPCRLGQIYQSKTECVYCECVPQQNAGPLSQTVLCSKMDCTSAGCWDASAEHVHGSVWATPNPCKHRACVNGHIKEMEVRCHPPPADNCRPLLDDSRCCPIYHCADTCKDGDTWTSDCNSCYCRSGLAVCTERLCSNCTEGETWKIDCNTCQCIQGLAVCTQIACADSTGNDSCVEGDRWEVGCNTCVCVDGLPACTLLECPSENSAGCPSPVRPLVLPEQHPNGTCTGPADCTGAFTGCCDGRCVTLSQKATFCPVSTDIVGCPLPKFACSDDHQCPGALKCCPLAACGGLVACV
ncbi:kielin/chordin-like protein [Pollicipes pollicipes]|uniref:kielin/chordin-like protein n=1 Tax=Pollicipes pollicipes TaxID=41117 RepID=UPI001885790A|nr:kielin/chordin-like protein [Pollicipes pollicipes]